MPEELPDPAEDGPVDRRERAAGERPRFLPRDVVSRASPRVRGRAGRHGGAHLAVVRHGRVTVLEVREGYDPVVRPLRR